MRTTAVVLPAFVLLVVAAKSPQQRSAPGELLPDEQIQQVLNRMTFGPRPGDADRVRAMGIDKWIDLQLHPDRIDDHAAEQLLSKYSIFAMNTQDIVRDNTQLQQLQRQVQRKVGNDSTMDRQEVRREALAQNPKLADMAREAQSLVGQVQSSSLARAVASERQLNEVMVDFWENHFNVFAGKGQTRVYLAQYDRDVIRPHALGKFRDLLGAVAKSPAMLFFLDNWESVADSVHPTLASRG